MALPSDGGNKRRPLFAAEALHPGDGEFERGGHVLAGHIAGGEDELADGVFLEGAFLKKVVPDAFVGGEQGPAVHADKRQPSFVGDTAGEVREMALEADAQRG